MAYMSDLMGRPVADADGEYIGYLDDLIASVRPEMPHPQIMALVVKCSGGLLNIPFSDVVWLVAPAISLTRRVKELTSYQPHEHDLFLARDVLDKQIIDTDGVRVVRVNDLELARVNGHFYVANVDIGGIGLLRRLGLAKIAQSLTGRFRRESSPNVIAWDEVELLPGNQPMRLKVPRKRIAELHPADIAEIISDLTRTESGRLLATLDVKTVADALEEVEPEFQASLVEAMSDEKVADVLEEMAPDEAADLLAELPEDRSQEILKLMEHEEAEDVKKLLTFPDNSAGSLMTTEFWTLSSDMTAAEAIECLRRTAQDAENLFYVYVTDKENHLLGVASLKDLVLAKPETLITEFMHARVVTVNLLDSQDEVAQAVSKYNLVALPVVDDEYRIHGIVTADDALDRIIPTTWKKRLPRMYH